MSAYERLGSHCKAFIHGEWSDSVLDDEEEEECFSPDSGEVAHFEAVMVDSLLVSEVELVGSEPFIEEL